MELRIVRKFRSAGALHSPMMSYLRRNYADLLGEDIELLEVPGGLAELQRRCRRRYDELSRRTRRAA